MLPVSNTIRITLALAIITAGAIAAGYVHGTIERIVIMLVAAMMAIFFAIDQGGDRTRMQPHGALENKAKPINEHSDFPILIEASPDPLLLVENARIVMANGPARQLFGDGVAGQNIRTAIRHAGAIERLIDPDALHSGHPIRLTGLGQKDQIWDMIIRPIGDGQKLVILTDRTSSYAAEKMRVDFVANASHELMTPLASIKGFIETLNEPDVGKDKDTRIRFLGIMAAETERMQALIRDLMSLSRIEAEKYQMSATPISLADIIHSVINGLRSIAGERAQDIEIEIDAQLPPIMGDFGQLQQLVSNIVTNAMKYGRAQTPITILLTQSRSGAMLRMSVSDKGEGIAPEHLPRLTERFYRVDSGRSRAIGGTGLGLSLVKHIVDRHRGHLEIRSQLGEGTTVSIMLPVAPQPAALPSTNIAQ